MFSANRPGTWRRWGWSESDFPEELRKCGVRGFGRWGKKSQLFIKMEIKIVQEPHSSSPPSASLTLQLPPCLIEISSPLEPLLISFLFWFSPHLPILFTSPDHHS